MYNLMVLNYHLGALINKYGVISVIVFQSVYFRIIYVRKHRYTSSTLEVII